MRLSSPRSGTPSRFVPPVGVASHPSFASGADDAVPGQRAIVISAAIGLLYAAVGLTLIVVDPRPGVLPTFPNFGQTLFEWEGLVALGVLAALVHWMTLVIRGLRHPPPENPPLRIILGFASLLSASIGVVFMVLLMTFVMVTGSGPPNPADMMFGRVFGFVLLSWPAALLILLGTELVVRLRNQSADARAWRQVGRGILVIVLLAPLTWPAVLTFGLAAPTDVAVCTLTTAFSLWAVHGMQRHRRMPFRMLAAGFGWGALVAIGYGVAVGYMFLIQGAGIFPYLETIPVMSSAPPALFEELAKGAGVVAVYLFARRWFDNVASGVVLGAAVGLGFNFNETLLYMTTSDPAFHFWARQSLGVMVAHTAFTALIGAGIGIAHQARSPRAKRIAISAGFTAAICAHFANNYLGTRMRWWSDLSDNPWVSVLLLTPGKLLMLQGPFVIAYIVLLRRGLRAQLDALRVEVPDEVATGYGAITPDEADALLVPARRFRLHVRALFRDGLRAYRQRTRLHAAQLDLAMLRWHQRRGDPPLGRVPLDAARIRVLRLKTATPDRDTATQITPPEAVR